jgi:hypothetical protein
MVNKIKSTKDITNWNKYNRRVYGIETKHSVVNFIYEGTNVELELLLTKYDGDEENDNYYAIDVYQGNDIVWGDYFHTVNDALEATDNLIYNNIEDDFFRELDCHEST